MAKLLPELDEDAQRCIVGGTGSYSEVTGCTPTAPTGYIFDQMNSMIDAGAWMGGMVDGYRYYGEPIVLTGQIVTGVYLTGAYDSNGKAMTAALVFSAALLADDATGIGVVDDIAIPFLLAGALIYDYCTAGEGNDSYPGPWTYNVEDPGKFHYQDPVDNESNFPIGGGKWWLPFGAAAGINDYKESINFKIIPFSPLKDSTDTRPTPYIGHSK